MNTKGGMFRSGVATSEISLLVFMIEIKFELSLTRKKIQFLCFFYASKLQWFSFTNCVYPVILFGHFYRLIWESFPIQKWPLFSQLHVFKYLFSQFL